MKKSSFLIWNLNLTCKVCAVKLFNLSKEVLANIVELNSFTPTSVATSNKIIIPAGVVLDQFSWWTLDNV